MGRRVTNLRDTPFVRVQTAEAASGMNQETDVATHKVESSEESSPEATTETPTAKESSSPAATAPAAEAAPAEAAPAPPAGEAPAAESAAGERPSDRLQVGAKREEGARPDAALKPKPVNPVTEGEGVPIDTKSYPPPNARTAPTDEEEAELAKLMEGASAAEVLDTEAAAAPKELESGSKQKGKVIKVTGDSVFVDLGTHLQGVVPLKQFEPKKTVDPKPAAPAEAEATEAAKAETPAAEGDAPAEADPESHAPDEGAEIEVVVSGLNADEGLYELRLPAAAQEIGDWDEVESGKVVEVTITGKNKGGLECKVSGIRGFMPMGQISIFRVENPEEYVGQRLTAVITEANRARKNVILSHRAVMERERAENRDKLIAELAPGQMRDGVVRSLRDFGAFVDLGGVDGLVHVSKLSWDRISHPKEVLTEGQTIQVKIEKIDKETGKIALSYREAAANPWDSAEADFPVNSSVTGKITKTMDFGAFVRLGPGVEGLIHISELDHKRVHRVTDVVSEGQEVEAKVLSVDRGKQRIALSLKALMAAPAKPERQKREDEPDEPKRERPKFKNLKGGTGSGGGDGEKFGLKW
ncbi:30S ribosomal protein S1 [Planctomycetes bacterium MalM25]|nr:30S ribosomal protein S1 [Planctomycetes bacterium MalM25]